MDSLMTTSLTDASGQPQGPALSQSNNRGIIMQSQSDSDTHNKDDPICSQLKGDNENTSILLDLSEYFFDDDFAIPFDATLKDEVGFRQRGLVDESDEGIDSSGTTHRGRVVPSHSRSDSCLFSQPDFGDSTEDKINARMKQKFEISLNSNCVCFSRVPPTKKNGFPDCTNASNSVVLSTHIHRTASVDFSTAPKDLQKTNKFFNDYAIAFSEMPQPGICDPASVTVSLIQAVLEGSSCPQIKELLKRTAEALDYRLSWGEIAVGTPDYATTAHRSGRLKRSTSHGNILTAASLAGMRQALFNIKEIEPKKYRSVGVSTSECSYEETSLPDTTATPVITTWARVRSSRESLNCKKSTPSNAITLSPSAKPPKQTNTPDSTVAWRAVKEVAGREMTTWGQLRRTASLGNRKAQTDGSSSNNVPSNLHTSLVPCECDATPLSAVSRRAIHRYSGTLLEIFMRARAHSLVSSSCLSSTATTNDYQSSPPKPIEHFLMRVNRSTGHMTSDRLLQTDAVMVPCALGIAKTPATLNPNIGDPKISSQPPLCPPPRRSRVASPHRNLRANHLCLQSASLLTMSADPESECMSRLRENRPFMRIKNPRSAMIYPGLGHMVIPRQSRIESSTFLSQTLPDLSLLGRAASQELKSGTPTTRVSGVPLNAPRISAVRAGPRRCASGGILGDYVGISRTSRRFEIEAIRRRIGGIHPHRYSDVPLSGRLTAVVRTRKSPSQNNIGDRSLSEPRDFDWPQRLEDEDAPHIASGGDVRFHKPGRQSSHWKKSISFNGSICKISGIISPGRSSPSAPDTWLIPKNWGIYGKDPPPLATFQPSIDDQNGVSSTTRQSDVDIRYRAMVMDVIRAVQETIAYFCQPMSSESSGTTIDSSGGSEVALRGAATGMGRGCSGRGSPVAVVNPFMVLISDGLIAPQTRTIFPSKPKSRIWLLVEESCRPSTFLGGIEHHVMNEVLIQVKALTGAMSEKARFRAFVCACLNQRALLLWLNSLVNNEALVKRFCCDGAFIRQCRYSLRGLYADLTTHLEQLLNFSFKFDLALEAKRTPGVGLSIGVPAGTSKSATRKTNHSSDNRLAPARTSSATAAASTVKKSGQALSIPKVAAESRMVRPVLQPATPRSALNSANSSDTKPLRGSTETTSLAPLNRSPLATPSSSVMRGKVRAALSTFRRSVDFASPPTAPRLVPLPPPHRPAILSGLGSPNHHHHHHHDAAPLRVIHPSSK